MQIEEYREQLKRIRKRMFQTGIGGADIDDGVYGYPEERGYEGGGPKGILYKYAHPACNMIKDEAAFCVYPVSYTHLTLPTNREV